jgi:hypothetical protein
VEAEEVEGVPQLVEAEEVEGVQQLVEAEEVEGVPQLVGEEEVEGVLHLGIHNIKEFTTKCHHEFTTKSWALTRRFHLILFHSFGLAVWYVFHEEF